MAEHRRQTLTALSGRVVELGAGNGLNFRHYPTTTVAEVVAVEPEAYLRERARAAAARAPVPITVVDAVADELPFPDESFDAAVASLVLCSVPDQATALAELRRVLRPGGELRFYGFESDQGDGGRVISCWAAVVAFGPHCAPPASEALTRLAHAPVRRLDLRREEIEVEVMGRVWIERAKAEVLPHVRAWSLNAVATTVLQGALATGRLAVDRNYAGLGVGTALAAHVLANRGGTQSAAEFGDTAVFVVRTALTCHEAMRAYDSIASVHT